MEAIRLLGFEEDGQAYGYEKDLMEAISQIIGIDIIYEPMLWTEAQETVLNGDAHIITGMVITNQRKDIFDFSDPYLYTAYSIISTGGFNTLEELVGKKVVVQDGSNTVGVLDEVDMVDAIKVPSPLAALKVLEDGAADAWIENHQVASFYINKNNYTNYKMTPIKDTGGQYAIAVNKEFTQLTKIVNKALLQLHDKNVMNDLDLNWFGLAMIRETSDTKIWLGFMFLVFIFATLGSLLFSYNHILRIKVTEKTKELEDQNIKLRNFSLETANAFGTAIEVKDVYTGGHSQRVAEISNVIGHKAGLGKEELFKLYLGALIHDVGKVGIPDHILKKPGRLTDSEYAKIKAHPEIGEKILRHLQDYKYIRQITLYHHERYDGRTEGDFGAYHGLLKGKDIPLAARIVSIADSYDAMTSDRPYRKALDVEEAKRRILEDKGKQFDPELVDIFLKILEQDKDI